MGYGSETAKIRDKIAPYLEGFVIDIGCGHDKVKPDAYGIDGRQLEGVDLVTDDLYSLYDTIPVNIPRADCVFSSHTLEHLENHYAAINCWTAMIREQGYLILYLPDGNHYNNAENPEHLVDTKYDDFMFWFKRVFCGEGKDFRGENLKPWFRLIESGLDIGEDRYSFYLVAQKTNV